MLLSATALVAFGSAAVRAAGGPAPLWAYGFLTPPKPGEPVRPPNLTSSRQPDPQQDLAEQTRLRRVPGSDAAFSLIDIRDAGNVIDWFPGDHPPMPDVVAHGPVGVGQPTIGCADCHLPTGQGRPENAPVAGQTAAYLLRQLEDFRSDARASADPRKANTRVMIALAKAMNAEEMQAAAAYYAAIKWKSLTRVIETDLVPRTRLQGNLFVAIESARTEPIAGRIIEVPENEEQSEVLGNPRSGFIAYVPAGSIRKGEVLVTTGGGTVVDGLPMPGRTLVCAACHGPDLMGVADAPGIAGRSPSYLARQLYDFQQGTRRGKLAPLMQPVVANLSSDDIVALAAYVASRSPASTTAPP